MGIRIRIRIRIRTVSSFLRLSALPPTVSATMSIQVKPQASTETPLISLDKGAAIDDVWSTDDVDSEHPMSCGIFTQKKDDEVFSYTYGYHEVKIVLEGIIILEDRSQGIKIEAKAGDVLYSASHGCLCPLEQYVPRRPTQCKCKCTSFHVVSASVRCACQRSKDIGQRRVSRCQHQPRHVNNTARGALFR